MPRALLPAIALLVIPVAWLACQKAEREPRTMIGANPALEGMVAAYCERSLECSIGRRAFFDVDTCVRANAGLLCADVRGVPNFSVCERALRELDCVAIRHDWLVSGCEPVLQALVDASPGGRTSLAGGLCLSHVHCPVGMACDGEGFECAGHCVPTVGEGEPCRDYSDCHYGLHCSRDGVCTPPQPAGSRCSLRSECEDECVLGRCRESDDLLDSFCSEQRDCGSALRCRAGRCTWFAAPGESCAEAQDCYPGLACVEGGCAPTVACHAGRQGDPCMSDLQCKGGLSCQTTERRCVDAPRRGEACSLDLSCGEGLSCENISLERDGVCRDPERKRNDGETCEEPWECASWFCDQGRCAKPITCE